MATEDRDRILWRPRAGEIRGTAHPALGAHAVGAVDPDVLGDDLALLRELEVLLELQLRVSEHSLGSGHGVLTLLVLETIVDSACGVCVSTAVPGGQLAGGRAQTYHDCGVCEVVWVGRVVSGDGGSRNRNRGEGGQTMADKDSGGRSLK